jgi:hypothetical protein
LLIVVCTHILHRNPDSAGKLEVKLIDFGEAQRSNGLHAVSGPYESSSDGTKKASSSDGPKKVANTPARAIPAGPLAADCVGAAVSRLASLPSPFGSSLPLDSLPMDGLPYMDIVGLEMQSDGVDETDAECIPIAGARAGPCRGNTFLSGLYMYSQFAK